MLMPDQASLLTTPRPGRSPPAASPGVAAPGPWWLRRARQLGRRQLHAAGGRPRSNHGASPLQCLAQLLGLLLKARVKAKQSFSAHLDQNQQIRSGQVRQWVRVEVKVHSSRIGFAAGRTVTLLGGPMKS